MYPKRKIEGVEVKHRVHKKKKMMIIDLLTHHDIQQSILKYLDDTSLHTLNTTSKTIHDNYIPVMRERRIQTSQRNMQEFSEHLKEMLEPMPDLYPRMKDYHILLSDNAKHSLKLWLQKQGILVDMERCSLLHPKTYIFQDKDGHIFQFNDRLGLYIERSHSIIPEPQTFAHLCALIDYLCSHCNLDQKIQKACTFVTNEMIRRYPFPWIVVS